jgi:hypothetical protein
MSFRITGLPAEQFRDLFGLTDQELSRRGAKRVTADSKPGFPDRVELRDAEPGEPLILINHVHQPTDNPYRASHAIFVREGATTQYDNRDEIPESLRLRLISLRAFDSNDMMLDADVVDGRDLHAAIDRMFENADAAYLHAHYAKRGCYAARVDRA